MQIKSLEIKGLFGTFDYNIDFPLDEHILIMTGCNGYGKTTILNIINSLSNDDLYYFFLLQFDSIQFIFTNGRILRIEKKNEDIEGNENNILILFTLYANENRKGHTLELKESTIIKKLKRAKSSFTENFKTKEFHEFLKKEKKLYSSLWGKNYTGRECLSLEIRNVKSYLLTVSSFINDNSLINILEKVKKVLDVNNNDTDFSIDLFNKLIKKIRLVNKTFALDKQNGLIITSFNGNNISIEDLSEGERNILVVLSSIFFLENDSILLIDNPEYSLHIEWQSYLLDIIEEIAEAKNLQVIVVTHSPQIIGGRWEDCYDLTEAIGLLKSNC